LTAAATLLGLESAAAASAGVALLVASIVGRPSDRAVALTLAAFLVLLAAGVAVVALGLWRSRPAAQTPAYLAQFFAGVVAYYQRHTLPAVTIVILVAVVVAVAALSSRETREALSR
jgi:carbon starvation protein CstA